MKKLFAILLATLMLVAFTACSNEGGNKSDDLDQYKIEDVIYESWPAPEKKSDDLFYFDMIDSESVIITGFSSVNYAPHEIVIPAYFTFENKDAVKEEDKVKKFVITGIADNAFANNSSISKVTFAPAADYADYDFDEVPFEVGKGAFRGCVSMQEIAIPEYVSALGENAFYGCSSLKKLQLAENGKLTELAFSTFGECVSLEQVTIPAVIKTVNDAAFLNCKGLKTLVISEGVEHVGKQAFQGCEGLETLTLPVSLSDIGTYAFSGCSNIKNAKVPAWVIDTLEKGNLENIEIIAGERLGNSAFKGCELLTTVIIPDSVIEIGDSAFLGCKNLKEITLPAAITKIGPSVFKNCASLESVVISDKITSIGFAAFKGCASLTEVKIPANVVSIDKQAFSACKLLANIEVAAENTKYQTIDGSLYSKDGTVLMQYAVGKSDEAFTIPAAVTTVDPCAFENCAALKTLNIPSNVTTIGNAAFNGCANLANVTIPAYAIGLIPKPALQSVVITEGESIGANAFANASKLTSVSIPASVTGIGKLAFNGCDALATITVDEANTVYKTVDNVLYTKDGKTLILYAAAKAETAFTVPAEVTAIEANAFTNAAKLTDLTIPATVATIGANAFSGCNALANVDIPAFVIPMISKNALVSVVINSGTEISDAAFAGCAKLATLTLADSITTIGDRAFEGCALTNIAISKNVTLIGESAFRKNPIAVITVDAENTVYANIGTALGSKDGTKLILYPAASADVMVTLDEKITTIAPYAFENASNILRITLSAQLTEAGTDAFAGCTRLVEIVKNGFTQRLIVGRDAFGKIALYAKNLCETVEESKISALADNLGWIYTEPAVTEGGAPTVTFITSFTDASEVVLDDSISVIYNNAFAGLKTLTKVTLSANVTKIGDGAFANCTALTTIVYGGTMDEWKKLSKGNDWSLKMETYTIVCSDGSIQFPEETPKAPTESETPAA